MKLKLKISKITSIPKYITYIYPRRMYKLSIFIIYLYQYKYSTVPHSTLRTIYQRFYDDSFISLLPSPGVREVMTLMDILMLMYFLFIQNILKYHQHQHHHSTVDDRTCDRTTTAIHNYTFMYNHDIAGRGMG